MRARTRHIGNFQTKMEMASNVMRFALATFFMKHGGRMRLSQTFNDVPLSPASCESIDVCSSLGGDATPEERVEHECSISQNQEDDHEVDATAPTWEESDELSGVVRAHISNLNDLLIEQHAAEFSSGVAELREYVVSNGLLLPLLGVLVDILAHEEQEGSQRHANCVSQVIVHMCFESGGEPSAVFDQMTELLLEAATHCDENKDAKESRWLKNAIDEVTYRLQEYRSNTVSAA